MLHNESLDAIELVVQNHLPDLALRENHVLQVLDQVTDSAEAIISAKQALADATLGLEAAKRNALLLESTKQHAQRDVEVAAFSIATDIASQTDLDPYAQTLYTLAFNDRRLSWDGNPGVYFTAAEQSRVALTTLMERLQPGEPMLRFSSTDVAASIATGDNLVAHPPIVEEHGSYKSLTNGSIMLVMPDAPTAKATEQELVSVRRQTSECVIISKSSDFGHEHLARAASNDGWLVIGSEAITDKLEHLSPQRRLVAMTALKAAEIEVTLEVDSDLKNATRNNLVSLIAYLAAGTGQETYTRPDTRSRDPRKRVTVDTPLTQMAKSMDKQSIRYLAQTIGLSKDTLRDEVKTTLCTRVDSDTSTLDQLAKDIASLDTVDKLLDTIF